jgi:hypothetical protein
MAINFPNNPAVNDTFTVGGTKFTFTGVKWETGAVVDLSSDTTPTLGGDLDAGAKNINNVGVITATNFVGDGSGLTGITASGSGVIIKDNDTTVGTAATINFGDNLSVSPASSGIVTVTAAIAGINTSGTSEFNNVSISGVTTTGAVNWGGHMLPTSDSVYDIGSADYKIRHIFVSDNSLKFIDSSDVEHPLSVDSGRLKFGGGLLLGTTIKADPTSGILTATSLKTGGAVTAGSISTTAAGGAGSNLSGDGRLTLQFPSGGGGGIGMFSVYSGTSKNIEFLSGGSATFAGTISDSMGPLRRLGINNHNAATYTLVASDTGKLIREATNSANITIPQNVFSAGDMITIFNVSGGNNTITSGAGITLYNTADGATGNRTLAAKGVCTIACTANNEFIISGSGLS